MLSIAKAYPGAPVHTSVFNPDRTFPAMRDLDVRPSALNHITPLRRWHRVAFPVMPRVFSRLTVDADVLIASSAGFAHGVHTTGAKVVYCHTPARWLYQPGERYVGSGRVRRTALAAGRAPMVKWDQRHAASADRYIANSTVVQDRIRDTYGIDATIIHPAVTLDAAGLQEPPPQPPQDSDYFLCVGQLLRYKNVAAVVEAFRRLPDLRLVVVGSGTMQKEIQATLPSNVTLYQNLADEQMRWLYARCQGLVAASYEDFGITPLEAQSFGRPVAALRWGGYRDTVVEGRSGLFFERPQPDEIADAVVELSRRSWSDAALRAHAAQFSEEVFITKLRQVVDEARREAPMVVA